MFLYIDATSGGLLIQALLGGFAGVGFVARLVWSRFGRSADQSVSDEDTEMPSGSNEERNAA